MSCQSLVTSFSIFVWYFELKEWCHPRVTTCQYKLYSFYIVHHHMIKIVYIRLKLTTVAGWRQLLNRSSTCTCHNNIDNILSTSRSRFLDSELHLALVIFFGDDVLLSYVIMSCVSPSYQRVTNIQGIWYPIRDLPCKIK